MHMSATSEWHGRLQETQHAFDSVAADYDGPRGNNAAIQDMREEMWRWLDATLPANSRLLDLGCGTGLDAVRMARHGHHVTATDWSSRMVERTARRAASASVAHLVKTVHLGAHQLDGLSSHDPFDSAYSNLGPLNCVPDLAAVSRECARLLKPGGILLFTVIGRLCPWEIAHYSRLRRWSRISVRWRREALAVGMNRNTVWTQYYTPRELYRRFEKHFALEHYRGLCVFVPPPYLASFRDRHPSLHAALWSLDRRSAGWPLLRQLGDHFLIVMRKR